jgi:hypothetical protein
MPVADQLGDRSRPAKPWPGVCFLRLDNCPCWRLFRLTSLPSSVCSTGGRELFLKVALMTMAVLMLVVRSSTR